MLEKLREIFDIIIIDGTPCGLVTDSVILSRMVDSTIIIASYGETKKEDLKNTIKSLRNVGAHIAGVVLNKMPKSKKKYKQSYYYGSTLVVKEGRRSKESSRASKTDFYTVDMEALKRKKRARAESDSKPADYNTNDILKDVNSYLDN